MTDETAVEAAIEEFTGQVPIAAPPEEPVRSRPESVLRNSDFVKLWTGESVSLIGTQITQFALPLVAVLTLGRVD